MSDAPLPISRLARLADRFGASASFLCAVHCALLPAVLALLPALGVGFLADHGFEYGFIAFASVLAVTTAVIGYRRHRRFRAFWFLVPGMVLLALGVFVDPGHTTVRHAVLVSIGGTLVAIAHLVNLRLAHGHVHDATCGHLSGPPR